MKSLSLRGDLCKMGLQTRNYIINPGCPVKYMAIMASRAHNGTLLNNLLNSNNCPQTDIRFHHYLLHPGFWAGYPLAYRAS